MKKIAKETTAPQPKIDLMKKEEILPTPEIDVTMADEDSVDTKGRLLWKRFRLALTPALVSTLREYLIIGTPPPKRDYKAMKMVAVAEMLDNLLKFSSSMVMTVNPDKSGRKKRSFMLSEASVIHPDDWVRFQTRMDQIDKMEAEDK